MNEKQQQLTFDKGITNVPSDALCSDNSLSECVGMIYDKGEFRPIQDPEDIYRSQPPQEFDDWTLLYVHNYNGVKRYIFWDASAENLVWCFDDDMDHYSTLSEQTFESEEIAITSIGNTLIVSDKTGENPLYYYVWKPNLNDYSEYNQIPQPDVSFWFVNGTDNGQGGFNAPFIKKSTIDFDGSCIDLSDPTNPIKNQGALDDQVFGLYRFVEEMVKEDDGFTRPFFLRYALRLYNGEHMYPSQPILVIPSWKANCYMIYTTLPDSPQRLECGVYYGKLYYQINTDYSDYSDLVEGIDVFVTDEVESYITEHAVVNGGTNQEGWRGFGGVVDQGGYVTLMLMRTSHLGGTRFMKKRDENDIISDLERSSVFRKISELGNRQMQRPESLPISDVALKNLSTQPLLEHDDYYSRCPISAKYIGAYNHRLQMAYISRGFFSGFSSFIMAEYANHYDTYLACVYIHAADGDRVIYKEFTSQEKIPVYFFYPDTRAYRVKIYEFAHDREYDLLYERDLKEHSGLNGAFYMDIYEVFSDTFDYQPDYNKHPAQENNTPEELRNQFIQSEVDNPFVFNAEGYTTVGDGDIVGFASQTTALSEGQFGQFPMLAFTTEGVWALEVGKTGIYTSSQPIGRDVCNNPNTITQTDGAVFFSTRKGLMVTVGRETKCVSEQLIGDGNGTLNYFLANENTKIAYDYRDSLLWIFNRNSPYCWIYSIKSGTFAKKNNNNIQPCGIANDYPDTIIQGSESIYSLLYRSYPDANQYSGLLITRPLKLENALALKSIMQVRHILQFTPYTVNNEEHRGSMTLRIFASNNLDQWVELHSLRGTPWKYYKFRYSFTGLKATDRFAGTMLITQERRTNKMR